MYKLLSVFLCVALLTVANALPSKLAKGMNMQYVYSIIMRSNFVHACYTMHVANYNY